MIDLLGVLIVKLLKIVLSVVPLRASLWIGRRLGDIAYYANIKRRSIAYSNLKSCFPEKGFKELRKIVRSHYRNLGMSVIELLKVTHMGRRYLEKYTSLDNKKRIAEALSKGKGVMLLTAHFGNWEMGSLIISSYGYKMSAFAREQKYPKLNALLNKHREMAGGSVVAKGFSLREIIKALKANGVVGTLFDQDAGPNGVFVDFFGRKASTASGPVAFHKKTGATILPSFVWRVDNCKHQANINEPLEIVDSGDKEKDLKANLKKINEALEDHIRRFPDQWLWSHKRWKSSPERRILILSDKKAGHLNQTKAVASFVKDALARRLKERGIEEKPIVKTKIVEVSFSNPFMRFLLEASSMFSSRRCQGCMRCLKFCLDEKSFNELKNEYADIIISCGSRTVATNIFLKYENNAKNYVIMKPGLGRRHRFDLVILPRHDNPGRVRSNSVITELAPVSGIGDRGSRIGDRGSGIGILIGGDAKNFILKKENVKEVIEGVLKIANDKDKEIFITTSRRTNEEIEGFLKERLGSDARCKMLVIANEKNPEGTIQNIFDNSEVVIVSPESISMISEAISSGRYVVVFKSQVTGKSKYERFIMGLEEKDYIRVVEPKDIYNAVNKILANKPEIKKIDDRENLIKRLKSII